MKLYLKIYRGYANNDRVIIMGHVFRSNPPDKYDLSRSKLRHAWAVISMFTLKTVHNAKVTLIFNQEKLVTKTLKDGYFELNIPYTQKIKSGWHAVTVSASYQGLVKTEKGTFLKPYPGEFGIISDIDDTLLVSHSRNFFRRLYILLTKNINNRKTFDDTAEFYNLLNKANRDKNEENIFYYVSSSEWNLYPLIAHFMQLYHFPKGILILKSIKKNLFQFLTTREKKHEHKFHKIKNIIRFHPELKFILLGDDGQHDSKIYEHICQNFSENIKAVYIRQNRSKPDGNTERLLHNIRLKGITTCYFKKSRKAIEYSRRTGTS